MTYQFKTKEEATRFLSNEMQDCLLVKPVVVMTLNSAVLNQEHFTYFDYQQNGKYNASIFETNDGFELKISFSKQNLLVTAAESGDLNLFKKEMLNLQSENALAVSYVIAIQNEKTNILQFYYTNGLFSSLKLFRDPLITAVEVDKLISFQFLLRKEHTMPEELLANIFHNNSKLVLEFILNDALLKSELLQDRFQTSWAKRCLIKLDNECTRMYKSLIVK
ncbi:MAG: hypothetical protein CFE25_05615 [Chitinophagaceae bacterium BSSC1]|nr:MAG: hypothetical protein CFE25_05615 [Chitinophagaceae bacterium BSSC1]